MSFSQFKTKLNKVNFYHYTYLLMKYCIAVRKKQKSDKFELFSTKHHLPLQRQFQDLQIGLKKLYHKLK